LNAAKALHTACRDYGFFYLNLEGFATKHETDELTRLARIFFSSPQGVKDEISLRNSDQARGYARLNENVTNGKADAHEGIDFYRPVTNPDKSKPLQGENQWPADTHIPGFRDRYEEWVQKMQELGLIMMEAMALGLGMSSDECEALLGLVRQSFWVMRIIGYPPLPTEHDGVSCGAHKDYGCLTFLYADPTPSALQVYLHDASLLKSVPNVKATASQPEKHRVEEDTVSSNGDSHQKDGNGVWINADPIEGCVVCNIGEMWEIWTKGLYKSTLHRVIHRGTNYRVSIPFFFEPNFDAFIQPLAAIDRLQDKADVAKLEREQGNRRNDVVYGNFLMNKVAGNFSTGDRYGNGENQ